MLQRIEIRSNNQTVDPLADKLSHRGYRRIFTVTVTGQKIIIQLFQLQRNIQHQRLRQNGYIRNAENPDGARRPSPEPLRRIIRHVIEFLGDPENLPAHFFGHFRCPLGTQRCGHSRL